MYIQHFLSYDVRNFRLNWLTFLEAMTAVLWGPLFIGTQCRLAHGGGGRGEMSYTM